MTPAAPKGTAPGAAVRPVLVLGKDVRALLRAGHPWIYDRALRLPREPIAPGTLVEVCAETERGEPLAVGYYDPTSPIRVRVLDRNVTVAIDDVWVAERARHAAAFRASDPALAETDAVRAIHGEGDYMPGLVLDVYAGTGVAVFDGAAAAAVWQPRLGAVIEGLRAGGISVTRLWGRTRGEGGKLLAGDAPPEAVTIHEHGARYEVDVRRGQKTGFFLDQRHNRRMVRDLAADAAVLNLFSYTGGFSVQAALGGARRVTSVDVAAPAVEAARRNFALSGLAVGDHEFMVADAFAALEDAVAEQRCWDLVVVDPPSFAPSEKARPRALAAYRRLNGMALRTVAPGGLLVTASCSSHVTGDDLLAVIGLAAADAHRRVRLRTERGAASDHPVRAGFPEGRYLKLLVVHAE